MGNSNNTTLGKGNFQNLIKQVFSQTASIYSLESIREKLAFLKAVKNFESNYVYNWQTFLFPICYGPESSPWLKYTGFRSGPWASYDVLDTTHGGVSGHTITAEPWATAEGMPCLWDFTNGQPASITEALYCLSAKINSVVTQIVEENPYDDGAVKSLIQCNTNDIRTLFNDIYSCEIDPNCIATENLRWSLQRHLYELFSQLNLVGTADVESSLSADWVACEDDVYPTFTLQVSSCDIAWDPSCPLTSIGGATKASGAKIQLLNNNVSYDSIGVVGTGNVTVAWDNANENITINVPSDINTTYGISSIQSGTNVNVNLTDSSSTVDTVTLVAGSNITLIDDGNDNITISSTDLDTKNSYSNRVDSITGGVGFVLLENNAVTTTQTDVIGEGSVTVSRISPTEYKISGSQNIVGNIDSDSMLGMGGLTPVRSPDYYAKKMECCYEYIPTAAQTTEKVLCVPLGSTYDEIVFSGGFVSFTGPINTVQYSSITHGSDHTSILDWNFPESAAGDFSFSFWIKKEYPDWIAGVKARQIVLEGYGLDVGVSLIPTRGFQIYFGYPKNEPLDPEYGNTAVSAFDATVTVEEHLCLYFVEHSDMANGITLWKLRDFTAQHGVTSAGPTQNWAHVAFSWDGNVPGSSTLNLWIDGVQQVGNELSSSTAQGNGWGTITNLSIMGTAFFDGWVLNTSNTGLARQFDGCMADIAIYEGALTQAEVTLIYGSTNLINTPITNGFVNTKLREWWRWGEDPIINAQSPPYQTGDPLAAGHMIASRLNNMSFGSFTNYKGTAVQAGQVNFPLFAIGSRIHTTPVPAGTTAPATSAFVFTGVPASGATVTLVKVSITMSTPPVLTFTDIVFEVTSVWADHNTQDPISGNWYFYEGVTPNVNETAQYLAQVIDGIAGFSATESNNEVNVETTGHGASHNTSVTVNGAMAAAGTFPDLAGGIAPITCITVDSSSQAAFGRLDLIGTIPSGATLTITSTLGIIKTYEAVNIGSIAANGQLIGNNVAFERGDSGFPAPTQAGAAGVALIEAINSINGHNQTIPWSVIQTYPEVYTSGGVIVGVTIRLGQAELGVAGNTAIPTVNMSNMTVTGFSGGTDPVGGIPSNKEQYSQDAFFNKFECSTQPIDFIPGYRYDITLTGYNTFKLPAAPACYTLDNLPSGGLLPSAALVSGLGGYLELVKAMFNFSGSSAQAGIDALVQMLLQMTYSLDVAGIGINIRNSESCIEDPKNIFLATNYYDKTNQVDNATDVGGLLGTLQAAANINSKAGHLSKYGWRSFFGKWKINLSLTVGEASDRDPDKVNLYYKGEGVEIDLFSEMFAPFEALTTNSVANIFNPAVNRFEIDHYNPFRHRFYAQWDIGDLLAMGVEDLSKRLEGNVVENVIVKQKASSPVMVPSTGYYLNGTVVSSTHPAVAVGDTGYFFPLYSTEYDSSLTYYAFEFQEHPGLTLYMADIPYYVNILQTLSFLQTWQITEKEVLYNIPETCIIPPYDTIEVVTWGFDSGSFWGGSGLLNYTEPDGSIGLKTYLEEFTIKQFEGEDLCSRDKLAENYTPLVLSPFSSSDFHWSGGPPDSNCNLCPEWNVHLPLDLTFYDGSSNEIIAVGNSIFDYTTLDSSIDPDLYMEDGTCVVSCPSVYELAESATGLGLLVGAAAVSGYPGVPAAEVCYWDPTLFTNLALWLRSDLFVEVANAGVFARNVIANPASLDTHGQTVIVAVGGSTVLTVTTDNGIAYTATPTLSGVTHILGIQGSLTDSQVYAALAYLLNQLNDVSAVANGSISVTITADIKATLTYDIIVTGSYIAGGHFSSTPTVGVAPVLFEWTDKSGLNNHALQPNTGGQPVLVLNAINGYPTVDWGVGSLQEMYISYSSSLDFNNTGVSIFWVAKNDTLGDVSAGGWAKHVASLNPIISKGDSYTVAAYDNTVQGGSIAEALALDVNVAITTSNNNATDDGTFNIHGIVTNKDGNLVADKYGFFKNGVNFGFDTATFNVGVDNSDGVIIGRGSWEDPTNNANTDNRYYEGQIAELILIPGEIDEADRLKLEGYFAWRYGLQASLAVTHPYYAVPPLCAAVSSNTYATVSVSKVNALSRTSGSYGLLNMENPSLDINNDGSANIVDVVHYVNHVFGLNVPAANAITKRAASENIHTLVNVVLTGVFHNDSRDLHDVRFWSEYDSNSSKYSLKYSSIGNIAGVEIKVDASIVANSITLDSSVAGWLVSETNGRVVLVDLSGGSLPAGTGTLFTYEAAGSSSTSVSRTIAIKDASSIGRCGTASPAGTAPNNNYGDINGDGIINILDTVRLIAHIIDPITANLSADELVRADINGDGIVDISDLLLIRNYILNPSASVDNLDRLITTDDVIGGSKLIGPLMARTSGNANIGIDDTLPTSSADLPSNTFYIDESSGEVWYNFAQDVNGFKFGIFGMTMEDVTPGAAITAAGITLVKSDQNALVTVADVANGTNIVASAVAGGVISSGSGVLFTFTNPTGKVLSVGDAYVVALGPLNDPVFTNAGVPVAVSYYDRIKSGTGLITLDASLKTGSGNVYEVTYTSDSNIYSLEADLSISAGTSFISIAGGDLSAAGFSIAMNTGNGKVLATSATGALLPPGTGVLFEVTTGTGCNPLQYNLGHITALVDLVLTGVGTAGYWPSQHVANAWNDTNVYFELTQISSTEYDVTYNSNIDLRDVHINFHQIGVGITSFTKDSGLGHSNYNIGKNIGLVGPSQNLISAGTGILGRVVFASNPGVDVAYVKVCTTPDTANQQFTGSYVSLDVNVDGSLNILDIISMTVDHVFVCPSDTNMEVKTLTIN